MPSVEFDRFCVVGRNVENGSCFSPAMNKRYLLLKYRYRGSFPPNYVPTLDNDTFASIKTQPKYMQCKHWILIANFRQIFYFTNSFRLKKYSFFKQKFEQIMPEPLQSHPTACSFYTVFSAFHLLKFQ